MKYENVRKGNLNFPSVYTEELKDTKTLKTKDRQHNDQKEKDKQRFIKQYTEK